jgi:hypothetical protein
MSVIAVDVRGIPEVKAALGKMEGPAAKKMLQLATKEGGKVLKKAVQAEAPKGATGKLRRSVSARTVKRNRPGTVIAPRPKVAFYRHMVIGGTRDHGPRNPANRFLIFRGRGGENVMVPRVKGNPPNPFVSRGFDRGQAAAMAALEKVVDDYLDSL